MVEMEAARTDLLRQKKDAAELLKRYEQKQPVDDSGGASNGG